MGNKAIIDSYVQIPVYTYMDKGYLDDLNFHNCPYLDDAKKYY